VLIKERYGVDIMAESEFYFHYSKNVNLVTTAKPINPPFARHHPLKVTHLNTAAERTPLDLCRKEPDSVMCESDE
jgi:hypothetical protein